MAPSKHFPLNRSSIKSRFACNFLQALQKLNHKNHNSPPNPTQTHYRRYRKIKLAAYASMASAVGAKRAWSRAMLWKIRNRAVVRRVPAKTSNDGNKTARSSFPGGRRSRNEVRGGRFDLDNAKELRKLVPGGEAMDFCCLLDETAHYIKCLTSQVEIMRNIADLSST